LDTLLRAYQSIRYSRTRETQLAAFTNHHIFHLEDGPAQQARDDSMRLGMAAELARESGEDVGDADGNANVWADRKKSQRQFSYDAEAEAERWWVANESSFNK
jgi:salicylate hydroxylase